jgi:hypothetical protein
MLPSMRNINPLDFAAMVAAIFPQQAIIINNRGGAIPKFHYPTAQLNSTFHFSTRRRNT